MSVETPADFKKTLLVWWRYGREHGGDSFQVNPQTVIDHYIEDKVRRFRQQGASQWRWWQAGDDLIVERPPQEGSPFGPGSRIYYLLDRGYSVIENVHLPPPDDRWRWYVLVSDFLYDQGLDCWLMKELFLDVVVEEDDRTYHIFDLPDMAQALDVGLITPQESGSILKRVDWLVNCICRGNFPFEEIQRARQVAEQLGWD